MSAAKDIATHLVNESLATGIGTDVFTNDTPSTPVEVIVIYDTAGYPSEAAFGEHNIAMRSPGIQVQVRSASQGTAQDLAELIHTELNAWSGGVFSGVTYGYSETLQDPFFLKRDGSRNVYMAFNAILTRS